MSDKTSIEWTDASLVEWIWTARDEQRRVVEHQPVNQGLRRRATAALKPFPYVLRSFRTIARRTRWDDVARLAKTTLRDRDDMIPRRTGAGAIGAATVKVLKNSLLRLKWDRPHPALARPRVLSALRSKFRIKGIPLARVFVGVIATKPIASGRRPIRAATAPSASVFRLRDSGHAPRAGRRNGFALPADVASSVKSAFVDAKISQELVFTALRTALLATWPALNVARVRGTFVLGAMAHV